MKSTHRAVAFLAAMDYTARQISQDLGISAPRVGTYLKMPEVQKLIEAHRVKLGLNYEARVNAGVPKALTALEDILESEEAPPGAKISAAREFLDRAKGKPVQKVESSQNTLKDIYELLDKGGAELLIQTKTKKALKNMKTVEGEVIDTEQHKKGAKNPPEAPEALEALEALEAPTAEGDYLDQWVEENIDNEMFQKRSLIKWKLSQRVS